MNGMNRIILSQLGQALGMVVGNTIDDIADKIVAVTNRGAWNGSITTSGGSVTIPVGYHNGSGKVTANISSNTLLSKVSFSGGGGNSGGGQAYNVSVPIPGGAKSCIIYASYGNSRITTLTVNGVSKNWVTSDGIYHFTVDNLSGVQSISMASQRQNTSQTCSIYWSIVWFS